MNDKIDSHSEHAMALFREGYNCSQSVLGAFCNETGIDFETAMKLSSSFGGGMGRLREVCGAVSGMFMVAGLIYGYADPLDKARKTEHYKLIQLLAQQFEKENGSIICRDLLGIDTKKSNPIPETRTENYYNKRPCVNLVGQAAEMIEKMIKNNSLESNKK